MSKHEDTCCCDHCTEQRSWTSTEEYLQWSCGADFSDPEPAGEPITDTNPYPLIKLDTPDETDGTPF